MSDFATHPRKRQLNGSQLHRSFKSTAFQKISSAASAASAASPTRVHMASNLRLDLTSPTSPTSAVSPSCSDQSLMSISPGSPTYRLAWRSYRETKLPSSSSGMTDQDGDTEMLSPESRVSREDGWQTTTTSPILSQLVSIPFEQQSTNATRPGSRASQPPARPSVQIPNNHRAQLEHSIQHLGHPLVPLIAADTCLPHPEFPRSILQYHLLTHNQLDSLARWYHQTIDNTYERYMYPCPIQRPWIWSSAHMQRLSSLHEASDDSEVQELELATKRRRFGRFIGLRGCESPDNEESAEALAERMDQEWRAALKKAAEEEEMQEKMWRGRW